MAKTLADINSALQVKYNGPTKEKNGFTYIPWNEAARVANTAFGIDGYNVELLSVEQMGQGYAARVRVTVYPEDSRAFSREGVGYNELNGDSGRAFDTAVKGAASDALNRTLKLFGPAFGLDLYDKSDPGAPSAAPAARQQQQARPTDTAAGAVPRNEFGGIGEASEKRTSMMLDRGYTEVQISKMDKDTVAAVCNSFFKKTTPPIAPAGKPKAKNAPDNKPAAAPKPPVDELNLSDGEDDAIPF